MKLKPADTWWLVLPLYLLSGLLPGLADAALGEWVNALGFKPGMATAVVVNLLLPVLAIGLGAANARPGFAGLGAIVMTGTYILGLAFAHPQANPWDVATLLRSIPPVLIVACLGYAVLGTLAAQVARRIGATAS